MENPGFSFAFPHTGFTDLQVNTTALAPTKRAKIRLSDIQRIADLVVSRRLTETEACCRLGIRPETWRNWKSDNKDNPEFGDALTRVKASRIQAHLANIEDAGFGRNGHRADWRASDRYLERIDPQRFNDRATQLPVETDALADSLLSKMLDRAYATKSGTVPGQSLPCVEVEPAKDMASLNASLGDNQDGLGI